MLTLEIAGVLERYADVFDLDIYHETRTFYLAEVLCSKDPFLQEIALFIKTRGFRIPLSSRFYAYTRLFVVINKAKSLKKLLLPPQKK